MAAKNQRGDHQEARKARQTQQPKRIPGFRVGDARVCALRYPSCSDRSGAQEQRLQWNDELKSEGADHLA